MIKHIVMWKIKDSVDGLTKLECATKAKNLLENLSKVIEEIESIEVGVNTNNSTAAYDLVLVSVFKDEKALQAYQIHPAHLEVGKYIETIKISRTVVDYTV